MSRRRRIVWTERAVLDVEKILDGMIERGASDPAGFHELLERRVDTLSTMPTRCRIVAELRDHGLSMYRELLVDRYRVVFRIRSGAVVLLGVLDHRRDLEELLLERALDTDD